MNRSDALESVLADFLVADALMPWPCPSDFGPEGRYRLLELLAAGRDSLVYRATDRRLSSEGFDATVAIKVLRTRTGEHREALAIRRAEHPSVLRVLDHGRTEDGHPYIVTEFVDGGDLSAASPPVPPRRAAGLMAAVCRGIQRVHSSGLVHCDLKPANIVLTRHGEPKIVDFELARWNADAEGPMRGNAAFMSPEQCAGDADALTPPSDIYALGGILFWLLTGRAPHGETTQEVQAFHDSGAPAPDPRVGGDLRRIVRRAMARERSARYHSAGEMAEDLERWLAHEPIPWTRPSGWRRLGLWGRRRPALAVAAVALAAGSAAGGAWLVTEEIRESHRIARTQVEAATIARAERDAMRQRMGRHLEWFYGLTFAAQAGDDQGRAVASLLWLNWLARWPGQNELGPLADLKGRVSALRTMIKDPDGLPADQLDGMLARYCLAFALVEGGETVEPLELARQIRDRWENAIPSPDPLWRAIDAVERGAQANATIHDPARRRAALGELERFLAQSPLAPGEPPRLLLERVCDRLRLAGR